MAIDDMTPGEMLRAGIDAIDKPRKDLAKAVASLRDLSHLCDVLNNRKHAGLIISATMWSALYQRTNEAKALLKEIDRD